MNLQTLAKQLEADEKYCATGYWCTKKKYTIGMGRNLTDNPLTVEERNYLNYHETGYQNLMVSRSQALYLLEHDINNSFKELCKIFPDFKSYSDEIQHILLNIHFQIGNTSFLGFVNMIAAVKRRDWKDAAAELRDSVLWRKDTPKRSEARAKRFEKEAARCSLRK